MPRPPKCRCVELMPGATFFQPQGVPLGHLEEVCLAIEEMEAIRLKDLEELEQEECAERMHVSRATFQRVLESARRKIAEALINGKAIHVDGGNFEMAILRFKCAEYSHEWEVTFEERGLAKECPSCSSKNIHRIDQ